MNPNKNGQEDNLHQAQVPTIAIDLTQITNIISVAIDEIKTNLQAQNNKVNTVITSINELMGVIEKLGKVHNLDYSNDLKDWVSLAKLQELKNSPR